MIEPALQVLSEPVEATDLRHKLRRNGGPLNFK